MALWRVSALFHYLISSVYFNTKFIMHILNITFCVEKSALNDWKNFMNQVFIPYANVQEKFSGHNLFKVLVDDDTTETYSYQLIAKNEAVIDSFSAEIFPSLLRELTDAFGERVLLFDTKLEELNSLL